MPAITPAFNRAAQRQPCFKFSVLPLYDAHNHLQDDWLAPHRAQVVADLRAIGLKRAIVNGTHPADWPAVTALARDYDWVLPSYGLHPWHVGNRPADWQKQLLAAIADGDRILASRAEGPGPSGSSSSSVEGPAPAGPHRAAVGRPAVALAKVGEIGLDRWILDRAKPDDPRLAGLRRAPLDEQIEVFVWQLEQAAQQNRAVTIHCLDAFGALLDVLKRTPLPKRGFLLHAYGGPTEMVKPFADLGAYFSFNGSFLKHATGRASPPDEPKNRRLDVWRAIPADRLLIETDAPAMPLPKEHARFHLPPAAEGTTINHPANLAATYTTLADLRGIAYSECNAQVQTNFMRLFDDHTV